jgi:flagellar protein FlaI
VIKRLLTKPMDIPPMMLPLMNSLIQVRRIVLNDQVVRRVDYITEILGINNGSQEPIVKTRFKWSAETDTFTYFKPADDEKSVFRLISEINQIPLQRLHDELERRETILKWMVKVGVEDYEDVGEIIRNYYHTPDDIYNIARLG